MIYTFEWLYALFSKTAPEPDGYDVARLNSAGLVSLFIIPLVLPLLQFLGRLYLGHWPSLENVALKGHPIPGLVGLFSLVTSPIIVYRCFDIRRQLILEKFRGLSVPTGFLARFLILYAAAWVFILFGYMSTYYPMVGLPTYLAATQIVAWYLHASGKSKRWNHEN
jgi:hypothetical protein